MDKIIRNQGFLIHLAVYVAVNILLIIIDLTGSPDAIWFFWPLLGWGLGVLGHAAAVYFNANETS